MSQLTKALLLLVPALLMTAACTVSLDRDPPVRITYLMEAKRPAESVREPIDGSLVMGTVRVAPEFSTRGLIYRMDDTRYVSDFHHDWFAPVRDQVYSTARDWLHDARVFHTLLPPSLAREADYRLDILVNTIHGDLRDEQSPAAVLELQAYLSSRGQEGERRILLASTLQSRQPLSEATPAQVAAGLSRGLADILTRLESELVQALP